MRVHPGGVARRFPALVRPRRNANTAVMWSPARGSAISAYGVVCFDSLTVLGIGLARRGSELSSGSPCCHCTYLATSTSVISLNIWPPHMMRTARYCIEIAGPW